MRITNKPAPLDYDFEDQYARLESAKAYVKAANSIIKEMYVYEIEHGQTAHGQFEMAELCDLGKKLEERAANFMGGLMPLEEDA